MKTGPRSLGAMLCACLLLIALSAMLAGQAKESDRSDTSIAPALTIYNQQFAVVRQGMALDLKPGENHLDVTDITAHLEPDSVFLRPLDEHRHLRILEQNYRNDPVSESMLLSFYEGKTIDFVRPDNSIVQGKVIRSGFVHHQTTTYGERYYQEQSVYQQVAGQPVVEVNGKLQFSLPGRPVFPDLADDTVLKPTLSWEVDTDKPGKIPAELSYITGGMTWEASYNAVAPEKGDDLELVGWVTLDNQSGKTFQNARIKLMAGDVNKIQRGYAAGQMITMNAAGMGGSIQPQVTERAFDEYHLYTLERPATLHDRETKQMEFVRASGVKAKTVYVYDGWKPDQNYGNWSMENIRNQQAFGTLSNPKIWVMQEFRNSAENHLGMPLPKGKVRFYRRDSDGQLEFTGENEIDHTPKDELIRVYSGNAFDLSGERRRADYHIDGSNRWVDESFEIKVRNHKSAPAEVRIVEHLYRWSNWEIRKNSDPFEKTDSQQIAFNVQIPADSEKVVTYQVHYSW